MSNVELTTKPNKNSDCYKCEHYDAEFGTCGAFYPELIPEDILSGKMKHRNVVKGQTEPGLVFHIKDEFKHPVY